MTNFSALLAQVPQAFEFQGVARDLSGQFGAFLGEPRRERRLGREHPRSNDVKRLTGADEFCGEADLRIGHHE